MSESYTAGARTNVKRYVFSNMFSKKIKLCKYLFTTADLPFKICRLPIRCARWASTRVPTTLDFQCMFATDVKCRRITYKSAGAPQGGRRVDAGQVPRHCRDDRVRNGRRQGERAPRRAHVAAQVARRLLPGTIMGMPLISFNLDELFRRAAAPDATASAPTAAYTSTTLNAVRSHLSPRRNAPKRRPSSSATSVPRFFRRTSATGKRS